MSTVNEKSAENVAPVPGRRLVRVPLSLPFLRERMIEGDTHSKTRCIQGLPPGAEFVGSSFDPRTMLANLFFHHDSFSEIPEGGVIPEITITIQTMHESLD